MVLTSIHLLLLGLYAFFLNQFACRLAAFISIGCRQPDADAALVDLEPQTTLSVVVSLLAQFRVFGCILTQPLL